MTFPVLYSIDIKKNIRSWSIAIVSDETKTFVITKHGLHSGKQVEKIITYDKPEHKKQAMKDATNKWLKKKNYENYYEKIENLNKDTDTFLPMLLTEFTKYSNYITYPCYIQPKYDGVRCIYINNKLQTRRGRVIANVPHIQQYLNNFPQLDILDGELFHPSIPFAKFSGLLHKKKLTEEDTSILSNAIFICFDYLKLTDERPYSERFKIMKKSIQWNNILHCVENVECKNYQDIIRQHDIYKKTYEGSVIKNINHKYYQNYRSMDVQKLKPLYDDEFKIVGFTKSVNNTIIWTCQTNVFPYKTFNVMPKGTTLAKQELLVDATNNFAKYKNKTLKVQYQELTPDGIPRFPVGLGVVDLL